MLRGAMATLGPTIASSLPTGKKVELHGIGIFQVDDEKKIEKVEFFYDRGELLGGLVGVELVENSENTSSPSTCPFMINKYK